MKCELLLLSGAACLLAPAPANAGELFGGLYAHDLNTPLNHAGPEGGLDVQLGWRGERIGRTPLQPFAFVTVNTSGDTHYGAIGLSAKFGDRLFVRPGIGIALHTGSTADQFNPDNDDIEFGSRILFEPELGIGARLSDRMTIEASWVHMSHGKLFSEQNSGIHNLGVRLTWKLN
ncbi:MAG TPA: acyloxyacyl hydrolase [Sphingomicrobium sp.]|nr:acyloxyacyl hydrolase [Sphingomicrobium sp.]